MTGYFARLASRTGLGGDDAPPAESGETRPLAAEETVTFVSQPQPQPPAQASVQPSGSDASSRPEHAAPVGAPDDDAAQILGRDMRDTARPALPRRRPSAAEPDSAGRLALAASPRAEDFRLPLEASFALPASLQSGTLGTRISRPGDAVLAGQVDALPDAIDRSRAFVAAPSETVDPAPLPGPARVQGGVALAAAPRHQTPEFWPPPDVRPHLAAPREPAATWSRDRGQPRRQPAPSVRIGSIQVEIHAAPPTATQPAPQPAMPAPQPVRTPSLRRFYLRDW